MPPATPKFAYGFVVLKKVEPFLKAGDVLNKINMDDFLQVGNISSLLDTISSLGPVRSEYPLTFEEMKQVWCLRATTEKRLALQRQ